MIKQRKHFQNHFDSDGSNTTSASLSLTTVNLQDPRRRTAGVQDRIFTSPTPSPVFCTIFKNVIPTLIKPFSASIRCMWYHYKGNIWEIAVFMNITQFICYSISQQNFLNQSVPKKIHIYRENDCKMLQMKPLTSMSSSSLIGPGSHIWTSQVTNLIKNCIKCLNVSLTKVF